MALMLGPSVWTSLLKGAFYAQSSIRPARVQICSAQDVGCMAKARLQQIMQVGGWDALQNNLDIC